MATVQGVLPAPVGVLRSAAAPSALETQCYLGEAGDAVYCVHHAALGNAHGTVLLCGALALESAHASLVWTRLARTLADAGWNAVRFDWRGTGESGGAFGEVTFDDWEQDLLRVHAWVSEAAQPPVVLLGLRGGALVASRAFAAGVGDALVSWEPPVSGRAHLLDVLRRKLAADYALGIREGRRTREQYVAEIEAGATIEIEGHPWTRRLWQSMARVELAQPSGAAPSLVVSTRTHRLSRPPFWQDSAVLWPDVSAWVGATLAFLHELGRSSSVTPPRRARDTVAAGGRASRAIVSFFHQHLRLLATHHVPDAPNGTAVLLTNFGYVPRSGQGGIAARICDELAAAGVHGFRVDLPGLGDSDGPAPADAGWYVALRAGAMVAPTLDVVEQLRSRFGIERVLLGGLCAAANTALYALERDPRAVSGLLLLEPEMFDREPAEAAEAGGAAGTPRRRPLRRLLRRATRLAGKAFDGWSWMRYAAAETETARHLPIPRRLIRKLLWLTRGRLPESANRPLVAAWQSAVRRRTPILVVTASGKMRELFLDRVNEAAVPDFGRLCGPGGTIEHVRVSDTNHTFTTGGAVERVTEVVTDWVRRRFSSAPLRPPVPLAAESARPTLAGHRALGQGAADAL